MLELGERAPRAVRRCALCCLRFAIERKSKISSNLSSSSSSESEALAIALGVSPRRIGSHNCRYARRRRSSGCMPAQLQLVRDSPRHDSTHLLANAQRARAEPETVPPLSASSGAADGRKRAKRSRSARCEK
eukprot:609397-Pleurochrysis_carterae.AAC.1